jgi:hypothetical protein
MIFLSLFKENVSTCLLSQHSQTTWGHAIAKAVRRRLFTVPPSQFGARVSSCRSCSEQSGSEAGFLGVLRFPLLILIPRTSPHSSSSIIRGCNNRPVNDWRTKWTQPHTPRIKKKSQRTFQLITHYATFEAGTRPEMHKRYRPWLLRMAERVTRTRRDEHILLTTHFEGSVLYKSLVGYRREMILCHEEICGYQILNTVVIIIVIIIYFKLGT